MAEGEAEVEELHAGQKKNRIKRRGKRERVDLKSMHRCQRNMVSQEAIVKAKENSELTIYEGTSPGTKIKVSIDFFCSSVVYYYAHE